MTNPFAGTTETNPFFHKDKNSATKKPRMKKPTKHVTISVDKLDGAIINTNEITITDLPRSEAQHVEVILTLTGSNKSELFKIQTDRCNGSKTFNFNNFYYLSRTLKVDVYHESLALHEQQNLQKFINLPFINRSS